MAPPKSRTLGASEPSAKTHWLCHGCPGSGGCGYLVPRGGSGGCNSCGWVPPASVSAVRGSAEKTGEKKKKEKKAAPSGDDGAGAKLKEARAAQKEAEATTKSLRERVKELETGAAAGSMEVDVGQPAAASQFTLSTAEAAEVDAKVKELNGRITDLKAIKWIAENEHLTAMLSELEGQRKLLLATQRATRPLDVQIAAARRWHVSKEKAVAVALQAQVAAQQKRLDAQEAAIAADAAVTGAQQSLAEAKADLAKLHDAARDTVAPAEPPGGGATAAGAVQTADGAAAALDMVSRAFAEEKWAERERQFAQREAMHAEALAHLHGLVAEATVADTTTSEAAPSDLGSVDDLEDDAAWHQVERGSRQKVLARQKRLLAKEVRSSLGGIANLAKVSATASPFKK
jgi:hypothetical protein